MCLFASGERYAAAVTYGAWRRMITGTWSDKISGQLQPAGRNMNHTQVWPNEELSKCGSLVFMCSAVISGDCLQESSNHHVMFNLDERSCKGINSGRCYSDISGACLQLCVQSPLSSGKSSSVSVKGFYLNLCSWLATKFSWHIHINIFLLRSSAWNRHQVTLTCAARGSLANRVTHLTVADEGASGVLTVSTQADVCVQLTLVHI